MSSRTRAPVDVLAATAAWSRQVAAGALLVGLGLAGLGVAGLLPGPVAAAVTLAVAGVGFVAGLPHGAVDHLLISRMTGRPPVVVTALYAAAAVAAWVVMATMGPWALGVVVLLSVAHFGLGELEVQQRLTGWAPGVSVSTAVAVAGTGALLLPLARSGEVLDGVATTVSPGLAAALAAAPLRLGLAALWLVAAAVAVTAAWHAGHRTVAVDVLLIGALGAFAPPLIAFAVWFGGWHALRHTGRLLTTAPGCADAVAAGRTGAAVARLARLALWPSAAATATLVALVAFTVAAPDPEAATAEALRVLLALTVPHMLVVLWTDRRERRAGATVSRP